MPTQLNIETITEWSLTQEHTTKLQSLLAACFPDYLSTRIYFKQLPQFRLLVWNNQQLIAQVGVEHRVINIDNTPFRIFGVIDLCCSPSNRSQGIATIILNKLYQQAKSQGIDFIVLFADDHRLYKREGFFRVNNQCKWLGIDEHKTIGILENELSDCMMVKSTSSKEWPLGTVDLMGYLF